MNRYDAYNMPTSTDDRPIALRTEVFINGIIENALLGVYFLVYISHFLSIISLSCMRLSYIIKTYLILNLG